MISSLENLGWEDNSISTLAELPWATMGLLLPMITGKEKVRRGGDELGNSNSSENMNVRAKNMILRKNFFPSVKFWPELGLLVWMI